MNHVKNIKEMLSISTGSRPCGDKTTNRNVATSGYSTLPDSQFFGSQFLPENSQGTSQDMSWSFKNSQQSSQEGSDSKYSNSYLTKPFIFGDFKDKSKMFGILDKFEDDRKKAKERHDSDLIAKERQLLRETLDSIQHLVADTERNTAAYQAVLEKFNNFASTLENNMSSLQSDISQQFETLVNKVSSQKELMTELQERVQKNGDTTAELDSHLQSLKNSLKEEQERQRHMLEEALKLLNTLVSEHSAKQVAVRVMDSAVQMSPVPEQPVFNILQENKLEGAQLTCPSCNLEQNQVEVAPQDRSRVIGKRRCSVRGRKKRTKRPLVLSQRSKDENSRPLMDFNKPSVSASLCENSNLTTVTNQDSLDSGSLLSPNRERKCSGAAGGFTPLNCWSQDSSSSGCLAGIGSILEKLSAESSTAAPVKPGGFWQLFDTNSDSD